MSARSGQGLGGWFRFVLVGYPVAVLGRAARMHTTRHRPPEEV